MAVIAIDLESTRLTCAIIGTSGKVIQREEIQLGNNAGAAVSLLIQKQIRKFLTAYSNDPIQIKSIGVSVPGISYSKTGNVWAPNIPGWENYPLLQDIGNLVKGKNIRVKIANNRTCCILGETWLGTAKGCKNAIYMSAGNGIGTGILIDGRVLHGFNDAVGAAGWMTVNKPFKEEYKQTGFFEYKCSGKGLLRSVREALGNSANYTGPLKKKPAEELTIEDIFKAYTLKDILAKNAIREFIEIWGMAMANLTSVLNPEIIVFGGPVFGPASVLIPEIKNEADKWAQPHNIQNVKFFSSKLGRDAGLYGAGQLVIGKI